jgi:hypothetical protein
MGTHRRQHGVFVACLSVVACSGGQKAAGPTADAAAPADHPADVALPRQEDAGEAGNPGAPPHKDCLPECIAAIRRSCQRPLAGTGTCTGSSNDAGVETFCFSNGVRETRVRSSFGFVDTFRSPDGRICYVVEDGDGGALIYRTPDGREVARVTFPSANDVVVMCDAQTYHFTFRDLDDPSCREVMSGQCGQGRCP